PVGQGYARRFMSKWEYARVVWVETNRYVERNSPEVQALSEEERATALNDEYGPYELKEWVVWEQIGAEVSPGRRVATRVGLAPQKDQESIPSALNRLGALGWELVSVVTAMRAIHSPRPEYSWDSPVRVEYIFKRPLS